MFYKSGSIDRSNQLLKYSKQIFFNKNDDNIETLTHTYVLRFTYVRDVIRLF